MAERVAPGAAAPGPAGNYSPWYDSFKGLKKPSSGSSSPSTPGFKTSSKVNPVSAPEASFAAVSDTSSFSFSEVIGSPAVNSRTVSPTLPGQRAASGIPPWTPRTPLHRGATPSSAPKWDREVPPPLTLKTTPQPPPKEATVLPMPPVLPKRESTAEAQKPAPNSNNQLALTYPNGKDFIYNPTGKDFNSNEAGRSFDDKYDLGPERNKGRAWQCCYWVCTILLLVLVALGIAAAVLIIKMKPHEPSISIGNFTVTSFQANLPSNGPGAQLATGLQFSVNLYNGNADAQIVYSQISTTVSYQTLTIGSVVIPGFTQGTKNTTVLPGDMSATTVSVPSQLVGGLIGGISSSNVQLELIGSVPGRYKMLGIQLTSFSTPINCQLNLKPEPNGAAELLDPPSCTY